MRKCISNYSLTQKINAMSYYDHFAEWLFSPERTLQQRTFVVLLGISILLLVNDVLGLGYYYVMHRKTEHFSQLTNIISAPTTDSTSRSMAINMRKEIMDRKPYSLIFLDLLAGDSSSHIKNHQKNPSVVPKTNNTETTSIKNQMLFFASSGGIYFISAFITFLMLVFRDRKIPISNIYIIPIITVILWMLGIALIWLCSCIPIIFKNWYWNYMLNSVLQLISLAIILPIIRKLVSYKSKRR